MGTMTIKGRLYAIPSDLRTFGFGSVYIRRADNSTGHYESIRVVRRAMAKAAA